MTAAQRMSTQTSEYWHPVAPFFGMAREALAAGVPLG
jgi:hypothetical protein